MTIVRHALEISRVPNIGTIHPVFGQRVSTQYKYAFARFPYTSLSKPSCITSPSNVSNTCFCVNSISSRFIFGAPIMLNAPQVSMQAIGLRSEA